MIDELRSPTEHEWEEFLILAPGLRQPPTLLAPASGGDEGGAQSQASRRAGHIRDTHVSLVSAVMLKRRNRPIYLTDEVPPGSYFLTL